MCSINAPTGRGSFGGISWPAVMYRDCSIRGSSNVPFHSQYCSSVFVNELKMAMQLGRVMTASSFGCQPSTDTSATSTSHIWWSGVHCHRSVDMELTPKRLRDPSNSASVFRHLLKTFSSPSTNVFSAL